MVMYWWYRRRPYGAPYWGWYPPPPPTPEEELRMLEEYKRELEQDLKELQEELRMVEERIKELKQLIKEQPTTPQPTTPASPPPLTPPTPPYWTPGYGPGYGWRWQAPPAYGMPPQPLPGTLPQLPPPMPNSVRILVGVDEDKGIDSPVSQVFARAPYLLVLDVVDGRVENIEVISNPLLNMGGGLGSLVADWAVSNGVRVVVGPIFGPNVEQVFKIAGIKMIIAQPGRRVSEILKEKGILKE